MQSILLVDDHEVVRLGLKALIERDPTLQVVGEAATAAEAVSQA
jgi:DNA-binding NarL/FixJ family response regulator